MDIQTLVKFAADKLRESAALVGIPVIETDVGNIDAETQANIAKRCMAVTVGWEGFRCEAPSSGTIYGEAQVVVSIFETPFVNRGTSGAKTILEVAREVANILHLLPVDGEQSPLVFSEISPVVALTEGTDGVVTCDVKFKTTSTL